MIQVRTCISKDHQEYQVSHICTFADCEFPTRWCCLECLQKGVHNHKKSDVNHIMNRQYINSKVKKQYENTKKNFDQFKSSQQKLLTNIIKEIQQIEKSLIDYKNQNYQIDQEMQKMMSKFEQCQSHLQNNNFQLINDEKINLILSIFQYQFDEQKCSQQLKKPLDSIKQQLYQIEMIIQNYQDNQKQQNNLQKQNIDLNKRKYNIQEIEQTNYSFYGSSISKNENFLAYSVYEEKVLKIYQIKEKKIIKEIKLDNYLYICQFTQDSSQLYVGLSGGYVYGYNVQDDFKVFYKQQIHTSNINNIITLQNQYLITCSNDKSIVKTDVLRKLQIFQLTGHNNLITAMDYNDKDEIIVSGSNDKSIKLWNCKYQSIIVNKEYSHHNEVRQIQLINNNSNILSLDSDGNLYKWQIDLLNNDLIKQQQFCDQYKIFNFYQVNQDSNLLLICNNYAKIINQSGETLNIIKHGGQNQYHFDCRQLDNLKYIQIRTQNIMMLAIAQD